VALGLGRTVVNGEKALQFSPKRPGVLPQFFDEKSILNNSQSHFYALEMTDCDSILDGGEHTNLTRFPLAVAEEHGTLDLVASVYSPQDKTFRESLHEQGPRVVTFANILKWNVMPLAELLQDIIELGKIGMGCDIEMEFAVDRVDSGQITEVSILQIRPMVTFERPQVVDISKTKAKDKLVESSICLGNGDNITIRDVIYVKLDAFEISETEAIAREIREMNNEFDVKRNYLLIGPGRWGTADRLMGIPVAWNHISNARSIVELGLPDLYVEPSFGSHFFQNITSLGISYFTVPPNRLAKDLNRKWFDETEAIHETQHLRHLQFDDPLVIQVDGRKGTGAIMRPGSGSIIMLEDL
jgi:hypothetical protein